MRLAFVTPRYGPEIMGGAESAARMIAERLVARRAWPVEVFTTCALDHLTWDNVLAPGEEELNGVLVRRFSARAGRSPDYYALDGKLRVAPSRATWEEACSWVELNGPLVPDLVEALATSDLDAVAFYPYLYYPTVEGVRHVKVPKLLHPAAHDEPALYLRVFRETFGLADALVYHTRAERELVERVLPVAHHRQILLGLGISDPCERVRQGGEAAGIGDRPYLVSLGRVDEHKGSVMLARFFLAYKARHPGPLALVFVGPVSADMPEDPDIVLTGAVDEADKWDILRDALFLISASAYESFSLVLLEAWAVSKPAVVNALCGPTREHCEASGGGLWFGSYAQFEAVLGRLLNDARLRDELGARGKHYVDRRFNWTVLIDRYASFVEGVVDHARQAR